MRCARPAEHRASDARRTRTWFESPLEPSVSGQATMVTITLDPPLPPTNGLVTLSGALEIDAGDDWTFADLAIMPFVWQFMPPHSGRRDHGWREGALHRYYGVDPNDGTWKITDARPGLQYAVFVVPASLLLDEHAETSEDEGPPTPKYGTLPEGDVISGPKFSGSDKAVHIESTPDDHLTGAVLGVGRAHRFRMMAWATKDETTSLIGEVRCEPSGYWTFGDLKEPLKSAESFTVALVNDKFDAVSPIPQRGGHVLSIRTQPHTPLLKHGAGKAPKKP
jgi:hypothetical protein